MSAKSTELFPFSLSRTDDAAFLSLFLAEGLFHARPTIARAWEDDVKTLSFYPVVLRLSRATHGEC